MRYLEKNLLALATTAALVTSICAQSPENSVTTEAVADFRRMSARQQQKVLAAMREAVHGIQDPYLDSVRKLVAAGVPGGGARIKTRAPPRSLS